MRRELSIESKEISAQLSYSLKPENVLIDQEGYAMLTDFGLSKDNIVGDQINSYTGTAEYFAPEILAI